MSSSLTRFLPTLVVLLCLGIWADDSSIVGGAPGLRGDVEAIPPFLKEDALTMEEGSWGCTARMGLPVGPTLGGAPVASLVEEEGCRFRPVA